MSNQRIVVAGFVVKCIGPIVAREEATEFQYIDRLGQVIADASICVHSDGIRSVGCTYFTGGNFRGYPVCDYIPSGEDDAVCICPHGFGLIHDSLEEIGDSG